MKGSVNSDSFKSIFYKKFFNSLQGKNTTEITIEKLILKKIRDSKKEKFGVKAQSDEKMIFKYIKEPEKNKTHWDCLIDEMVIFLIYNYKYFILIIFLNIN
jgi:hypothetical protein